MSATVLAGADARDLVRALTTSRSQPAFVMEGAARAVGVEQVPPNPLLSRTFDQAVGVPVR
jgi:hypothetical protein